VGDLRLHIPVAHALSFALIGLWQTEQIKASLYYGLRASFIWRWPLRSLPKRYLANPS